jgi:hypothetical protein
MLKIYVANNPTEAHFIAGLLNDSGIEAHVQGEALWGARGEVPPSPATLPSVWINKDEQAEDALAVIRHQGQPTLNADGDGTWRCVACGETIEGQFTECWNCGASRAGVPQ